MGRIVDTEIKNCVENEKKRRVETIGTNGQERTILCPLANHPRRRRPFAVFGPRKTERKLSGQFFRLWFFTGGNDEESLIESQRVLRRVVLPFFGRMFSYTLCTRKTAKPEYENVRTFTMKTVFTYVCKAFWNFIGTIEIILQKFERNLKMFIGITYKFFDTSIYITELFQQPIINIH